MLLDAITDTLTDSIKLLPFLFITYLAMEYIEHKTGSRLEQIMRKSGKWGTVLGSVLGVIPQCGFSTAASNLYAGRIITLGTLFAVFLSTSDEMLPILISEQVNGVIIVKIITVKVIIGMCAGLIIDFIVRKRKGNAPEKLRIEQMCDHHHCHCHEGKIFKSAFSHTFQVFFFIVLISFLLNLAIGFAGEDKLAAFICTRPLLGPFLAGLVGLIPNCASSVILTQLYLEGVLGAGAMIAGLLAGSGVGLLVLFKVNDDLKENIKITLMLYAIGVISGVLIESLGLVF